MKNSIREQMLKARKALAPDQAKAKELEIHKNLYELDKFKDSNHIAIYHSFHNEVDTLSIIDNEKNVNKTFYLPYIQGMDMSFAKYQGSDLLVKNKYGIYEPQVENGYQNPEINLYIIPIVGFTASGGRIGMGKGFYDRYLSRLKKTRDITIIGLAFDCQEVKYLKTDHWDVDTNIVITESRTILCSKI